MLYDLGSIIGPIELTEDPELGLTFQTSQPHNIKKATIDGLFGCTPLHSNLFCLIVNASMAIPVWFYDKYSDEGDTTWDEYVSVMGG